MFNFFKKFDSIFRAVVIGRQTVDSVVRSVRRPVPSSSGAIDLVSTVRDIETSLRLLEVTYNSPDHERAALVSIRDSVDARLSCL